MQRANRIIFLRELKEVRRNLHIEIKWSFPLETNIKTVRYLWDFIKREALMMC